MPKKKVRRRTGFDKPAPVIDKKEVVKHLFYYFLNFGDKVTINILRQRFKANSKLPKFNHTDLDKYGINLRQWLEVLPKEITKQLYDVIKVAYNHHEPIK